MSIARISNSPGRTFGLICALRTRPPKTSSRNDEEYPAAPSSSTTTRSPESSASLKAGISNSSLNRAPLNGPSAGIPPRWKAGRISMRLRSACHSYRAPKSGKSNLNFHERSFQWNRHRIGRHRNLVQNYIMGSAFAQSNSDPAATSNKLNSYDGKKAIPSRQRRRFTPGDSSCQIVWGCFRRLPDSIFLPPARIPACRSKPAAS